MYFKLEVFVQVSGSLKWRTYNITVNTAYYDATLKIKNESGEIITETHLSYYDSYSDGYVSFGGHGGGWLRGTITYPRYINGSYSKEAISHDLCRFEGGVTYTLKIPVL